jgi:hypothetical protein
MGGFTLENNFYSSAYFAYPLMAKHPNPPSASSSSLCAFIERTGPGGLIEPETGVFYIPKMGSKEKDNIFREV